MKKTLRCAVMFLIIPFLSGCGNLNSIHHFLTVDEGTGALVDIKQRAVLVSRKKIETTGNAGQTYPPQMQTIVCAEPSPDALSAYAAELAAEGGIPGKVTAKLAGATQESAAFVGLRTQSIQLLRDSLYRLCEGYMSGALDKYQYDTLMRRYQRYMIALLGIEQLTGAMRAPSVTIQTQGKAVAAGEIADLRKEIEKIDEEIQEKTKAKETLETDLKNEADSEEKKAIQKEIDAVTKAIEDKKSDKDDAEKGIKEERKGLVAEGSATASVSGVGLPTSRSDEHIQSVTEAVKEIVLEALRTDEIGQLCWGYLVYPPKDSTGISEIKDACKAHIEKGGGVNVYALEKSISAFAKIDSWSSETKQLFGNTFQKDGFNKRQTVTIAQEPNSSNYGNLGWAYAQDALDMKDAPLLDIKAGREVIKKIVWPRNLSELQGIVFTLFHEMNFEKVALCSENFRELFDKETACTKWIKPDGIPEALFTAWIEEAKKDRRIYLSIK